MARVQSALENVYVQVCALALLSTLPFLPGVGDEFIFDDGPAVLDNEVVRNGSLAGLLAADFWGQDISSVSSHKSYRPVTSFTFWLQAEQNMSSKVAWRLKIVNLGLNFFNAWLSLSLARTIVQHCNIRLGSSMVFSAGVFFAVHPLHTEPVNSIVGRSDLLYSLFFLSSSLLSFKLNPTSVVGSCLKYFLLSLMTFISMFCKEQGFLFLVFLAALELLKLFSDTPNVRKQLVVLMYLLVNVLIFCYLRLSLIDFKPPTFQPGDNPAAAASSRAVKLLSFSYIYMLNCLLLVCPSWLCFDWAMGCVPLVQSNDPRVVWVVIFWALVVGLIVSSFRELSRGRPFLTMSLALMAVPFLLCLNVVVDVGFVLAERNLYLSTLGYSLVYHYGLSRLASVVTQPRSKIETSVKNQKINSKPEVYSNGHKSKPESIPEAFFKHLNIVYVIHSACLLILVLRTTARSRDWATGSDLYISGLSVCPNNAKVHYNVAKKLDQKGDLGLARVFYQEAVRLEPMYAEALNNLGNLLRREGRTDQAERVLRRAVRVNPSFPAAHMNLAIVLEANGHFQSAEQLYLRALSLRKPYPDCTFNLGNLYRKKNSLKLAEHYFREGLRHGHLLSRINLVILLDELDRLQEARLLGEEGLLHFPDNPGLHFHLANTLGKLEEYEGSEEKYKTAIKLKPTSMYFSNLGVLYHRWGRLKDAEESYSSAISLDPSNPNPRRHLAKLTTHNKHNY